MAKNAVVEGTYKGKSVDIHSGTPYISTGFMKKVYLNKDTVESHEVLDSSSQKSMSSGIMRGLVGGALLGPVGMLAGGVSAKKKGTYLVAVQFKDGNKSLLEVDNDIYQSLIKKLF